MNPMMKRTNQYLGALAFLLLASAAQAVPVVQNHNFAQGETNWNFVGTTLLDTATASAEVGGTTNSVRYSTADANPGSLSQTLGSSFDVTNKYRLQFYFRGNESLLTSFALGTGGTLGNIYSRDVDELEPNQDPLDWLRYVVEFDGYSGNSLTFNFTPSSAAAASQLLVDDISIACVTGQTSGDCGGGTPPPSQTPEPGSLMLVGAALAGLAGMRMRKKN